MALTWKPEYSVNVKLIDAQHQGLVKTMNKLYAGIQEMRVKEALVEVLADLVDYAYLHFLTEESLFRAFNYEGAADHIAAHNAFKEKVADFQAKVQNNEIEVSYELVDFLENWLVNHLASMDKGYSKCFNDHGLF